MITRRRFLQRAAALAAIGAAAPLLAPAIGRAADLEFEPERGAKLRVLRWKRFVQGDEDQWLANTRRFTQLTGVEVQTDSENWEEVRPKAAVAANVGAGPDIIVATDEQPHLYPDKLLDLTELAEYLGRKYGGWFDISREFGMHEGRWIAIPTGAAGGTMVYRKHMMQAAGFQRFPGDFAGFLELCRALKARGTPPGLALGHATGDANAWCTWVLWGHGGKLADERNRAAINSRETIAALEYAKELYQTFLPGTASWLDPSNNKAFLAGEIGLTMNGISIYYAAKTSAEPKVKALVPDIEHALLPVGPIGAPTRAGLAFPAFVFKYTKYPNAAKEYLRFMMEKEQYEPWQRASLGYISHPLRAYDDNPVWKADRQHAYFKDVMRHMRHHGYAGRVGKEAAAAIADFIIVDMFAEVCAGGRSPAAAAQQAERRAKRHYGA
jgi:multiple sugar transport system substrate-binding protein